MSQQQDGFSKFLTKQKKSLFHFTTELVSNNFSIYLYYILIAIQHLQIIGFQCHSVFNYQSIGTQIFRTFTTFINPQHYLRTTSMGNWFIPVTFIVVLAHAIIICLTYYNHKKKNKKKDFSHKSNLTIISHYYTVIMCTVLTLPVFLPSLLVFYCHENNPYSKDRQCYSTYHLFLILLGLLNIIWILTINVYFFVFYYTRNPFLDQNVFTLSSSLWNALKFIIKIVPSGYLIFDENLNFSILFVFGVAAGLVGYTGIVRVLYPYNRYNKSTQKVMIYIEIMSITISVMFILQAFFTDIKEVDLTFIFSIIASIPLSKLAYSIIHKNMNEFIPQINSLEKQNLENLQKLIIDFIIMLQSKDIDAKNKLFLKFIKIHYDQCENAECFCHIYMTEFKQSDNYWQNRKLIFKIFLVLIDKALNHNKRIYSLALLKSYIQYFQLNNYIKSALTISKIMNQKIGIFDEYALQGMLYELNKNFSDTSIMEKYHLFSQHLIKFEKYTINMAKCYQQYWNQIMQLNSSLQKLMNLLKKSKSSKQSIDQQFESLFDLYPKNIRVIQIYKQLYKQVLRDYPNYGKYQSIFKENSLEKDQSKLLRVQNQITFSANEEIIVFNVCINSQNDIFKGNCEIVSVTNNSYKVFGFSSSDLIGKNINRLLPKIYCDFHDLFIMEYMNNDDINIKSKQMTIFPINSTGNIIQCIISNKIMPSITYGINLISFMKKKTSKQYLIIYDQRSGLVDSMTFKAQELLIGDKIKSNSISIPDHISDILPSWDYHQQQLIKTIQDQDQKSTYQHISLYRSDGWKEKYVKILKFELVFQPNAFDHGTFLEINAETYDMGIHTLLEGFNIKQEPSPTQKKDKQKANVLSQSINLRNQLNSFSGRFFTIIKFFRRFYLLIQVILLLTIFSIILYNYVETLNYYEDFIADIYVKQKIKDSQILILQSSHSASRLIYNNNYQSSFNISEAKQQIVSLQTLGQSIYQNVIQKSMKGLISLDDLMLDVKYFSTKLVTVIKSQTVTDAAYQFALYLLEIYKSGNTIANLQNNALFVFYNNIPISEEFSDLDIVFTSLIFRQIQKRQSHIKAVLIVLITLIFLSLLTETLYRLIVFSKIKDVMKIYSTIPISQIEKYPEKCENFIKHICPIQKTHINFPKHQDQFIIQFKPTEQVNESDQFLQNNTEYQQLIKFSDYFSILDILICNICFFILLGGCFSIFVALDNNLMNHNSESLIKLNNMDEIRAEISESIYFMNQYKNYGSQWNKSELLTIKEQFDRSILKIQTIVQKTTFLDEYLSTIYRLAEEAVYVINNNITFQKQLFIEEKLQNFAQQLKEQHLTQLIQEDFSDQISSFLNLIELVLIIELLAFFGYSLVYIPKIYKNYIEKYQTIELMYQNLGPKLQAYALKTLKQTSQKS